MSETEAPLPEKTHFNLFEIIASNVTAIIIVLAIIFAIVIIYIVIKKFLR